VHLNVHLLHENRVHLIEIEKYHSLCDCEDPGVWSPMLYFGYLVAVRCYLLQEISRLYYSKAKYKLCFIRSQGWVGGGAFYKKVGGVYK
jgi:hypothetical protein